MTDDFLPLDELPGVNLNTDSFDLVHVALDQSIKAAINVTLLGNTNTQSARARV